MSAPNEVGQLVPVVASGISLGRNDLHGGREQRARDPISENSRGVVASLEKGATVMCLGDQSIIVRAAGGTGLEGGHPFSFLKTVDSHPTMFLVDSGASLNLINHNKCAVSYEVRQGVSFQGVGGRTCHVLGLTGLNVTFGSLACSDMLFRVIEEHSDVGVYLATEFLRSMKVSVNLYLNRLSFPQPGEYDVHVYFGSGVDNFKVVLGDVSVSESDVANVVSRLDEGFCEMVQVRADGGIMSGQMDQDRGPWTDERLREELDLSHLVDERMRECMFEVLRNVCHVFSRGAWDIGDARLQPYDIELIDRYRSMRDPVGFHLRFSRP